MGEFLSAKEWSQEFDTLKRQIQSKRAECDLNMTEAKQYMEVLTTLETSLSVMSVRPMEYEIAFSEIVRRQVVLKNLMTVLSEHKMSFYSPTVGNTTRAEKKTGKEYSSSSTTDKGLILRHKDTMLVQEEMLQDLAVGIDKLYKKALTIGVESKSQVRLLDDLDDDVEAATGILETEAKHADAVRGKADMCWMYMTVAVQLLVIMILVIIITSREK